jgi:hypothetical protein
MRARVGRVMIADGPMLSVAVVESMRKSGVQVVGRAEYQEFKIEAFNLPAWRSLMIPPVSYGPEKKGRGGKPRRW